MKATSKLSSIIEIIASTIIFVIVIFVSVGAILSMNNSNKKAQALTLSSDCSNQIKTRILNSLVGSDRGPIYGITDTGTGFEAHEIQTLPGKRGQFSGIGFTDKELPYEKIVLFLKKKQSDQYNYFSLSVTLKNESAWDKNFLNELILSDEMKKINECIALENKAETSLKNPFFIAFIEHYKGNNNSKSIYEIKLDDYIYTKQNNQIYSNLFFLENIEND
jgi:hypothetical protein